MDYLGLFSTTEDHFMWNPVAVKNFTFFRIIRKLSFSDKIIKINLKRGAFYLKTISRKYLYSAPRIQENNF